MDTTSQHVLADVWLTEPVDAPLIEALLERVRGELTVVRELVHHFEPYGTTVLFVLAESHFALHAYPEASYLSLDIYVCDTRIDVGALVDRLIAPLRIARQNRTLLRRGVTLSAT